MSIFLELSGHELLHLSSTADSYLLQLASNSMWRTKPNLYGEGTYWGHILGTHTGDTYFKCSVVSDQLLEDVEIVLLQTIHLIFLFLT